MIGETSKIAFGGGCHWCTEAVFQALIGVEKVEQGYVASTDENTSFSEAVIVYFNRKCITLHTLIDIHLMTHNSRSNHSMRQKYRSAIYTFDALQSQNAKDLLKEFQKKYKNELITQVLPFQDFMSSREEITNYYFKNPKKPFCEVFIDPKLKLLLSHFSAAVDPDKVRHLKD